MSKAERLKPKKRRCGARKKWQAPAVIVQKTPPVEVFLHMVPHCAFFTHEEIAGLAEVCKEWAGMVGRLQHEAAVADFVVDWPQLMPEVMTLRGMETGVLVRLRKLMDAWRRVQPNGKGFWEFPTGWYEHPLLQLECVSHNDKLTVYRDWAAFNMHTNKVNVERTIRPEGFGRIMHDVLEAYFDAQDKCTPSVFTHSPFYKDAEHMSTRAKYMTMNWASRKLYSFIRNELYVHPEALYHHVFLDTAPNADVTHFYGIDNPMDGLQSSSRKHVFVFHWVYVMTLYQGVKLPWDFCFEGDLMFAHEHLKLAKNTLYYLNEHQWRDGLVALPLGTSPAGTELTHTCVQCVNRLRRALRTREEVWEATFV